MHWTYRIGDRALCMLAIRPRCLDGRLQIAHVVHGIKNSKDINAIHCRTFHKLVDQIVRVVPVA